MIISIDNGISAINSKGGYTYTAGVLFAMMHQGKAADNATNCNVFANVGKRVSLSATKGSYLTAIIGSDKLTINLPVTMPCDVVMLGSNTATASTPVNSFVKLSEGGFIWE